MSTFKLIVAICAALTCANAQSLEVRTVDEEAKVMGTVAGAYAKFCGPDQSRLAKAYFAKAKLLYPGHHQLVMAGFLEGFLLGVRLEDIPCDDVKATYHDLFMQLE